MRFYPSSGLGFSQLSLSVLLKTTMSVKWLGKRSINTDGHKKSRLPPAFFKHY